MQLGQTLLAAQNFVSYWMEKLFVRQSLEIINLTKAGTQSRAAHLSPRL